MEKDLSLYYNDDKQSRIDTFISSKAKLSRTQVQKLIDDNMILVNDKVPKAGSRLKHGDIIHITIPMVKESIVEKQDIPLNIIYQDDDIIVINKTRGMVVHPAAGHSDGTLVNALLYHCKDLSGIGGEERPGIVHRLDKDTSGVLVVAKNDRAHQKLTNMFQLRKIKKEYIALVYGKMKGREGIINLPIDRDPRDRKRMAVVYGGKSSVTHWKLKKAYKEYSLLSVFPETGRTHQIRVHLSHVGNPVVGDPEYAGKRIPPGDIDGQALHAFRLSLEHPIKGNLLNFEAPVPEDLQNLLNIIEQQEGAI